MAGKNRRYGVVCGVIGLSVAAGTAGAQPTLVEYATPTLDRWMYPFGGTPGTELRAPIFGALNVPGFDDRDGQFLVGWDTAGDVPAGEALERYRVVSVIVRASISDGEQFHYDPTADPIEVYYEEGDAEKIADEDIGHPVELFGAGYRNGWTVSTFEETSPFGGVPEVPPAEGARNVFAAVFDMEGNATDVSRQVRFKQQATAAAVGTTDAVAPGELVPTNAEFTFEVDLCDPTARAYFARSLRAGRVNVVITGLHPAEGGPGGGTGDPLYPVFYTKENPLAQDPLFRMGELELRVFTGHPGDYDQNGTVNSLDFLAFLNAFNDGDAGADFDGNCIINTLDFIAFLNAFNS